MSLEKGKATIKITPDEWLRKVEKWFDKLQKALEKRDLKEKARGNFSNLKEVISNNLINSLLSEDWYKVKSGDILSLFNKMTTKWNRLNFYDEADRIWPWDTITIRDGKLFRKHNGKTVQVWEVVRWFDKKTSRSISSVSINPDSKKTFSAQTDKSKKQVWGNTQWESKQKWDSTSQEQSWNTVNTRETTTWSKQVSEKTWNTNGVTIPKAWTPAEQQWDSLNYVAPENKDLPEGLNENTNDWSDENPKLWSSDYIPSWQRSYNPNDDYPNGNYHQKITRQEAWSSDYVWDKQSDYSNSDYPNWREHRSTLVKSLANDVNPGWWDMATFNFEQENQLFRERLKIIDSIIKRNNEKYEQSIEKLATNPQQWLLYLVWEIWWKEAERVTNDITIAWETASSYWIIWGVDLPRNQSNKEAMIECISAIPEYLKNWDIDSVFALMKEAENMVPWLFFDGVVWEELDEVFEIIKKTNASNADKNFITIMNLLRGGYINMWNKMEVKDVVADKLIEKDVNFANIDEIIHNPNLGSFILNKNWRELWIENDVNLQNALYEAYETSETNTKKLRSRWEEKNLEIEEYNKQNPGNEQPIFRIEDLQKNQMAIDLWLRVKHTLVRNQIDKMKKRWDETSLTWLYADITWLAEETEGFAGLWGAADYIAHGDDQVDTITEIAFEWAVFIATMWAWFGVAQAARLALWWAARVANQFRRLNAAGKLTRTSKIVRWGTALVWGAVDSVAFYEWYNTANNLLRGNDLFEWWDNKRQLFHTLAFWTWGRALPMLGTIDKFWISKMIDKLPKWAIAVWYIAEAFSAEAVRVAIDEKLFDEHTEYSLEGVIQGLLFLGAVRKAGKSYDSIRWKFKKFQMFKSKQAKQLRVEEAKRDRIEASRKTHEDNKAKWEDEINVAEKKVKRLEDGKTKLERKKIQRETELNELNVTHKELTELEAINDTLNKTARGLNGWSKFFDNLKNKFPILWDSVSALRTRKTDLERILTGKQINWKTINPAKTADELTRVETEITATKKSISKLENWIRVNEAQTATKIAERDTIKATNDPEIAKAKAELAKTQKDLDDVNKEIDRLKEKPNIDSAHALLKSEIKAMEVWDTMTLPDWTTVHRVGALKWDVTPQGWTAQRRYSVKNLVEQDVNFNWSNAKKYINEKANDHIAALNPKKGQVFFVWDQKYTYTFNKQTNAPEFRNKGRVLSKTEIDQLIDRHPEKIFQMRVWKTVWEVWKEVIDSLKSKWFGKLANIFQKHTRDNFKWVFASWTKTWDRFKMWLKWILWVWDSIVWPALKQGAWAAGFALPEAVMAAWGEDSDKQFNTFASKFSSEMFTNFITFRYLHWMAATAIQAGENREVIYTLLKQIPWVSDEFIDSLP